MNTARTNLSIAVTIGIGLLVIGTAAGGVPIYNSIDPGGLYRVYSAQMTAVPEPGTLALLAVAVCGAAVYQGVRSRRKRQ